MQAAKSRQRPTFVKEYWKPCVRCGTQYWGLTKAKFCGVACRNADYYERHAAMIREARRATYARNKALRAERQR